MIAKNDSAHESLAAQLKEHSVTREYVALVFDNIKKDKLTIDAPIGVMISIDSERLSMEWLKEDSGHAY